MNLRWLKVFFVLVFSSFFFTGCTNILRKEPKAGLQVITNDVSTSVFVNGQYLDKTPLIKKDLKPGEYYIELKPDDSDLAQYETSINLRGGLLTVVTFKPGNTPEQSGGVIYEMEALKDTSKTAVEFVSIPDGAIVEIPGKDKALAPVTVEDLAPGELSYKVLLPSYESQEHTINVVAGYHMLVTVKLAKQATTIAPTSIPTPSKTVTKTPVASNSAGASTSAQGNFVTIKSTNLFIDGEEVLRVRKEPSVTSEQIGLVKVAQKYPVLGDLQDGWFKIKLDNGSEGWISGAYGEIQ